MFSLNPLGELPEVEKKHGMNARPSDLLAAWGLNTLVKANSNGICLLCSVFTRFFIMEPKWDKEVSRS